MRSKALVAILTTILTIQLSGCGTLLHPERKGQKGGNLDPAIVVLDAAGLLLFVVPGLVAFGIDLYYGTIYLPGTAMELDEDEINMLKNIDGQLSPDMLAKLVSDKTGQTIDASEMVSYQASSIEELNFLINQINDYSS
ncbi:hypothetical protein [Vibrio sp. CAU 1672]|uniref:hypothetical protein n=1 Tax=Vibrio sp. CAU 1672 TaxID=3032594 RepID=UPI0023DC1115|nr:hypothetical protein [Vibrio sp. CAU 1672]MDF2154561.1 hypothetical protein [Vibrio sp. CAU 1672]